MDVRGGRRCLGRASIGGNSSRRGWGPRPAYKFRSLRLPESSLDPKADRSEDQGNHGRKNRGNVKENEYIEQDQCPEDRGREGQEFHGEKNSHDEEHYSDYRRHYDEV